jgi:anti-sigma factor RsiW
MTISAEDLSAFIDGELPPPRHAEVAAALAADPTLAARAAAFRRDRDRLAQAYAPVAQAPLPAAWLARIEAAVDPAQAAATPASATSAKILPFRPKTKTGGAGSRRGGAWRRAWPLRALTASGVTNGARNPAPSIPRARNPRVWAIAACLALLLGLGLLWRGQPQNDTLLQQAEAARAGRLTTILALQNAALPPAASRDALLRQATALPVRAPDLRHLGWQLEGLTTFRGAAQLRYSNAAGQPLTIYIRRSTGEPRFDLLRQGRLRVCVWQDDVTSAVIIADMPAGPMMRLAAAAYRDLNF